MDKELRDQIEMAAKEIREVGDKAIFGMPSYNDDPYRKIALWHLQRTIEAKLSAFEAVKNSMKFPEYLYVEKAIKDITDQLQQLKDR
jgi:hypothetical protein